MSNPHAEALARLAEQGYSPEEARAIVAGVAAPALDHPYIDPLVVARAIVDAADVGCPYGGPAWHRAVDRLIRIHRPEYKRLLAEERAKGEQP